MSPASRIWPRESKTKGTRYQVRYRPGGRDTDWITVATFGTLREARACKQWVDGELAIGRHPNLKAKLAERPETVAQLGERFGKSIATDGGREQHKKTTARLGPLGPLEVRKVTGHEVQDWVIAQDDLKPSSVRAYLSVLRQMFDWAEVYPNPARWPRLRVPSDPPGAGEPDPPSLVEFEALLAAMPEHYRDPLIALEGTGLRMSELRRLDLADLDLKGGRLRVNRSKSEAGRRRFVPLLPRVAEAIERAREGRKTGVVFPQVRHSGFRDTMKRRCVKAGIRHLHPHDFRDRYISLLGLAGVPLPLIRQIVGHSKNSTTLDVYTGVILDEPEWRLVELRRAVGRMTGLDGGIGGIRVGSGNAPPAEKEPNSRQNEAIQPSRS